MLKFTVGAPDEMEILIACGIAAYLIAFPIVIFITVLCAEVMRRAQTDGPVATRLPALAPGHPRVAVTPPRHAEVATAV